MGRGEDNVYPNGVLEPDPYLRAVEASISLLRGLSDAIGDDMVYGHHVHLLIMVAIGKGCAVCVGESSSISNRISVVR
jgi:hypothetical protein